MQAGPDETQPNPHGTYLDVYFNKYVPEMTARQLRDLLYPVLDFNARNKEEAYLDTVPPKVKAAIQEHHVLVGMNTEMVVHAKGKAPKKVRERDGETEYEEWIYGEPPQDVDFVRIVNDEVVRVETMRVGGQKIVRTGKEIKNPIKIPKPSRKIARRTRPACGGQAKTRKMLPSLPMERHQPPFRRRRIFLSLREAPDRAAW